MKLFVVPNIQCGECFEILTGIMSQDRKTFQLAHEPSSGNIFCSQFENALILETDGFVNDHAIFFSATESRRKESLD